MFTLVFLIIIEVHVMKLSDAFQRAGQNYEKNYPLNVKTAEFWTVLAIAAYPFSGTMAATLIAAPMAIGAFAGGLQRTGRLLTRFDR